MPKLMHKLVSGISCRHHGTRCIVSNMNNGRDATITNQIINEANRQKLELRVIQLENIVKRLSEKVNKLEAKTLNMVQDYKHAN
jgi:hypothetical protein